MNLVRQLREDQLLTQHALAERAGLAVDTVCHIERGRRCSPTSKRKLLKALRLPHSEWKRVFPDEVKRR